jgi:hypothetical protein
MNRRELMRIMYEVAVNLAGSPDYRSAWAGFCVAVCLNYPDVGEA